MKNKICFHNSSLSEAQFVIFGVPDETGSDAKRKGTKLAPNTVREISNKFEKIKRKNNISFFESPDFSEKKLIENLKVNDFGDIKKQNVKKNVYNFIKHKKIPVTIGGDHSISYETLSAINKRMKELNQKFSLIYFDAHPDFISSHTHYYGSVVYDLSKLEMLDIKKSILIGIRDPEKEEISNVKKSGIKLITSFDFKIKTIKQLSTFIRKNILRNAYISIDVDVADPAFAPGVNVPSPGGLSSLELLFLARASAEIANLGFDVMEISPPYDLNNITSLLGIKLIQEMIVSFNLKNNIYK